MCGRFAIFDEAQNEELARIIEGIKHRLKDNPEAPVLKTGEIFPTDNVPILVSRGGKQSAHPAKWGFPNFNKPGVIINAKAETLEEKPMFRKSFYEKRCVIPANGYFEWQKDGKEKTKYFIHSENPLIYMAGLYGIFRDKNDKPYTGFVVITTEPSSVISPIHNRMPVILPVEMADRWLTETNPDELRHLLRPNEDVIAQIAGTYNPL